jgi:hypothetical protein
VYIAKRAFESILTFLTLGIPYDEHAKFADHPLALDEHRRQERDLNDVKRMVKERCSIIDIVEHFEKRSKAESKAEALIPIRSGMPIDLTTVKLEKRQKRPRR